MCWLSEGGAFPSPAKAAKESGIAPKVDGMGSSGTAGESAEAPDKGFYKGGGSLVSRRLYGSEDRLGYHQRGYHQ